LGRLCQNNNTCKKKKKKKKERKKERKRAPLDKNHDKQMNELLRIVLGFDIM